MMYSLSEDWLTLTRHPLKAGIRYCRELIDFVQRFDMLNLFNVIDAFKDLVPIRISMNILDVKFKSLDMTYITRYVPQN